MISLKFRKPIDQLLVLQEVRPIVVFSLLSKARNSSVHSFGKRLPQLLVPLIGDVVLIPFNTAYLSVGLLELLAYLASD